MVISAIVGALCLLAPSIIPWGSHFESARRVVPADVDADRRVRPVPVLPVEREHAAHRHDPGAAARHRDVARPRRDAGPEGRGSPPRPAHRPRRPRGRLRPLAPGTSRATGSSRSASTPRTAPWTWSRRTTSAGSQRRATSSAPTSRSSSTSPIPRRTPRRPRTCRASAARAWSCSRSSSAASPSASSSSARSGIDAFTDRDVELAQLLVREASTTFDNARLYDQLRLLAYRDPLTGLANRHRLQDHVDHALARLRGRSPNHAVGAVHRPRSLQAPERPLRAREGRSGAQGHRRAHPDDHPAGRYRRAGWAATSSPSCSRTSTTRASSRRSATGSSRASSSRSSSTTPRRSSARASAMR